MTTNTYKNLTCRQWKLDPSGCYDGSFNCKYSHYDTGLMSPPVSITCRPWKAGCCYANQDECLYSHMDISVEQQSAIPNHRPALIGRNAAIARAAAFSGVDPTNIENLLRLVNAVRDADRALYPDVYNGAGRRIASIYPDTWIPSTSPSPRPNSVIERYRAADVVLSLPKTPTSLQNGSVTTRDIITPRIKTYPGRTRVQPRLSGANLEPLPSRKRTGDEDVSRSAPQPKKVKAFIDLTGNDHTAVTLPFRPMLLDVTNTRQRNKKPSKQKLVPQPESRTSESAKTRAEFQKVLVRLRGNEFNLTKNRDVLRSRWEADVGLRLQTVTDKLQLLSECFDRTERATQEAIELIEKQLL